jgi:molybdenum cofactor biosynthesis enzyme MoaA
MHKKANELYLRFVLLKACNAKCYFCHKEGDDSSPGFILDQQIILKAVRVAQSLGIKTFKFTGGEPLLYPGLELLIQKIKEICPQAEISLTTNGMLLEKKLNCLLAAGLDRANVSFQTLDRQKYIEIMGKDKLDVVKRGIALLSAAKTKSKICSAFSKRNADEILDMARWAKAMGLGYRVHNLLPVLDIAKGDIIPIEEIEETISSYPGATRQEIKKNGKNRLLFAGNDWEILLPDWRHWKKCGIARCPLNDHKKNLCKEGEVYALRVTPDQIQSCLMGNRKSFPFSQISEIETAMAKAVQSIVH